MSGVRSAFAVAAGERGLMRILLLGASGDRPIMALIGVALALLDDRR